MRSIMGILAVVVLVLTSLGTARAQFLDPHMVVANRNAGSISVIDVATNNVTSFNLPAGATASTPGYVVYSPIDDVVYVGDSANARLVAFDARTYAVVDPNIPVGAGAFHMWGNTAANQLWVTNPGDNTVSVIDLTTRLPLATIDSPEIAGVRTTPHDVVLDPADGSAYVTYFDAAADLVVKYSPTTFAEVDRTEVAEGPHVTLTGQNTLLYVSTQGGGQVEVLDRATLDTASPPIALTNAHGLSVSDDGSTLYASSFPGASGVDGLHAIATLTASLVNSVDAPVAGSGPHNLALSTDNTRLYATHTGASDVVSIFDVSGANQQNPAFLTTVQTADNPFGIAAVPVVPEPASAVLLGLFGLAGLRPRRGANA